MFSKWKYDRSWRNLSKSENLRRLSIRGHFHNMAFFCKSHVNIWFETTNKFRGGLRVKMSQNIRLSQTYSLTLFENYQKKSHSFIIIFGGKIQIFKYLVWSVCKKPRFLTKMTSSSLLKGKTGWRKTWVLFLLLPANGKSLVFSNSQITLRPRPKSAKTWKFQLLSEQRPGY